MSNSIPGLSEEEERQRHPCESSPCGGGGTCIAAAAAFAGGRHFVCRCPQGRTGQLCEEMGEPLLPTYVVHTSSI